MTPKDYMKAIWFLEACKRGGKTVVHCVYINLQKEIIGVFIFFYLPKNLIKMKEDLISYDTAKLAKEKEFNIMTHNFFQYNIDTFGIREESGLPKYYSDGCNQAFRPSQSLLQKWLREEHKIYIDIDTYTIDKNGKDILVFEYEIISELITEACLDNVTFTTHELALEEALQEALKLLP